MHGVGRRRICGSITLPFGVRSAVPLFDRLTQAIIRKLRSKGIPAALGYIDDFRVSAETEAECLRAYNCLIELLLDLRFVVNRNKCVPPMTRLTFMGIELDADAQSKGICRMTIPAKRERGAKLCTDFLARVPETGGFNRGSPYLASQWDAIWGFLGHCAPVVRSMGVCTWRTYITLGISPKAGTCPHRGGSQWPCMPMFPGGSACLSIATPTIEESASHHRICSHYAFFATDACTSWGMGAFLAAGQVFQDVLGRVGTEAAIRLLPEWQRTA
jgi:hypothetical protein